MSGAAGRWRRPHGLAAGRVVVAVLAVGTALTACSQQGYTTLDADGVAQAILTEHDYPNRDGWTSTGVSTETEAAEGTSKELASATGMPPACRDAFTAWTNADPDRKAGVNNNFTKFSPDNLHDAIMVQLAVRSFDQPPTALEQLRTVVGACTGTMTLTSGPTSHAVEFSDPGMSGADVAGLRITLTFDKQSSEIVTAVAQRGNNLAQVVGIAQTGRDVNDVVQQVLDAQVTKLEDVAG